MSSRLYIITPYILFLPVSESHPRSNTNTYTLSVQGLGSAYRSMSNSLSSRTVTGRNISPPHAGSIDVNRADSQTSLVSPALHCIVLYCVVSYSTVLYRTALSSYFNSRLLPHTPHLLSTPSLSSPNTHDTVQHSSYFQEEL